jgi:hypothetical protein
MSGKGNFNYAALEQASDRYPKPEALSFSYGTAGFRTLYVCLLFQRGTPDAMSLARPDYPL